MMRLKGAGPFACCTAAAADEFMVKDSASSQVAPADARAQQQPGGIGWWKLWRRQPPQKPAAAAAAVADTENIKQPQKQHKQKQPSSQRHKLRHSLNAGALAAASNPQMQRSALSSSCSVPLTSTSLSAAAIGCHSLSASAGVQAYQRAGGAIRHQDTGDSPSEIHSEFQQQKVLSSYGTSCERSGKAGGSLCSLPDSSDSKQQQQEEQQQQQPPPQQQAGRVQSVPGSLSSVLLQEPLQQQFSSSNSCRATAASASVSESSVHGAATDAGAARTSTAAAAPVVGAWQTADAPAGPNDSPIQPPRQQQQHDLQPQHSQQQQDHFRQQLHQFNHHHHHQQQQQQQQQASGVLPTLPSTASSSYLPLNYRLLKLESGRSFCMSDPQFPGSSSSSSNAAAVTSPASAPAAGTGSSSGGALSPFNKAATSPFAQLTLQQAVATTLMATKSLRQHLDQQQQQQPLDQRHSMPAASSAALSFASLSYGGTAATGRAAFGRAGSSSSIGTGPEAAAGGGGRPLLPPGGVTSRSTRISWAASSTILAPEPQVFEVLDPETSSTCSGHRILRPSASATSLSSMTSIGGSGSTAKEKLQQLRMAVSMGSFNRNSVAAAAVSDADAAAGSSNGAASSSKRFRSILRRSTAHSAVDTKSIGSNGGRGGSQQRRSKSAHVSVMEPQHMSAAGDAVFGNLTDQAGCCTAGSSRSLPPLPPASAAAAAAAGSPGPGSIVRKGTAAAVCGSTVSSFSSSSASTATTTGLLSAASSYGRQLPHSASMAALESQSTGGSSVTSLGAGSLIGGSLVALAVNRMHNSQSAPALRGQAGASALLSSSSFGGSDLGCRSISATVANGGGLQGHASSGALSSMSISSSAGHLAPAGSSRLIGSSSGSNSASSSCAVANAFADAFLAALAAGNTRWGSDAAVVQLLHETAKMLGLDKQLYVGKTAIIRRLNSGMDQLVKMVAANAVDSSGDSGNSRNAAAAAAAAELASNMPKPLLSVTCPDPKAKPSLVVAQYTFKWGLRKFTLRDELIVKNGQIMRLHRSRG